MNLRILRKYHIKNARLLTSSQRFSKFVMQIFALDTTESICHIYIMDLTESHLCEKIAETLKTTNHSIACRLRALSSPFCSSFPGKEKCDCCNGVKKGVTFISRLFGSYEIFRWHMTQAHTSRTILPHLPQASVRLCRIATDSVIILVFS